MRQFTPILTFLCVLLFASIAFAQTKTERAKSLYENGMRAYADGDYEKAVNAFRESYKLAPKSMLLYNLSYAQSKLNDYNDALESAKAADFGGDLDSSSRVKNSARISAFETLNLANALTVDFNELNVAVAKRKRDAIVPPASTSPLVPIGVTTTVIGILGVGAGVGLNFFIADDVEAFDAANDAGDQALATQLKSDLSTPILIGQASIIGGAIFIATGITLWVIGASKTSSEHALKINPNGNGVVWTF